jgi:phosphotransferase system enzyme I (PtsI)
MKVMKGKPISPGIAIGKVIVKKFEPLEVVFKGCIDSEFEKERFHKSRQQAIQQVQHIYEEMQKTKGYKEAEIFITHIDMLEDMELITGVEVAIENLKSNTEWALSKVTEDLIDVFKAMDSPYMRERAMDIKDISNRMQIILSGVKQSNILSMEEPAIIVAHELTPSDTAQLKPELVLGIVNEEGGTTSHAAIIARMMGVPMVVCPKITNLVEDGSSMIFDGDEGSIYLEPTEEIKYQFQNKHEQIKLKQSKLQLLKGTKAITLDGWEMQLVGNIGSPEDVSKVLENDAHGIGLFRTEFLYMGRDNVPSEEEQFQVYKEVAEKLKGYPVVIRTLDIGGDKELDYLQIPKEMNPFLGCRAIRFCLKSVDLWKVQLRAILRASVYGDIHMMFPMISTLDELRQVKQILNEVQQELRRLGIPFNEGMLVGMMMETPAAAVMADVFAQEVDFFSIGTNDLIQYTMAVDRMNTQVAHLYSQYDPSVIRLINKIVESGHEAGIWVGICGEAAGDHNLIPLWVGMGLDELSMSCGSVLSIREIVQGLSKVACEALVNEVLQQKTAHEIKVILEMKQNN